MRALYKPGDEVNPTSNTRHTSNEDYHQTLNVSRLKFDYPAYKLHDGTTVTSLTSTVNYKLLCRLGEGVERVCSGGLGVALTRGHRNCTEFVVGGANARSCAQHQPLDLH